MLIQKKITRIGALMIVSEVLIMLFVFRWLQSEFNGEKALLQKNIDQQFAEAKSRVMDSLISKNLIDPILNNPTAIKIHSLYENDLKGGHDSIRIIALNSQFDVADSGSIQTFTKTKKDSGLIADENIQVHFERDTADKLLVKGVKMFISRVSGPGGENDFFERHVSPGDTTMLKNFFEQNLEKDHLRLKTVWLNPAKNSFPATFYYESAFLDHPFGVQIEQYHSFLFREILPQILFAMLLLLITSAAFLFSFRSLRNQLRLAAMKDDFISNMSHELKTPVATVKVALEAMKGMNPLEQQEKMSDYLGMATQEMNRLESLVNKVMNGVLMENGKQIFQFEKVNLKSLIDQTLKSLQWQLQLHNAPVHFAFDSAEIFVNADPTHVHGIFANVIDNSLKYGKGSPEISVHLSQTVSDAIITFCDNGPGIPEEYLSKVFEKFFRTPSDDHHEVKGYGLGLSYVARVMKEHDGSVTVKNLPQGGCCFTLIFPKSIS
jgi:signal transduction histidine kinase